MFSRRRSSGSSGREGGSAIAEFVLIAALVGLVCAGIFQLAFALHVRNTLVDCAGEGARHAALVGSSLEAGVDHTIALIAATLPRSYGQDVTAHRSTYQGVATVEVRVRAPLPLVGFLGPTAVTATGRAVAE